MLDGEQRILVAWEDGRRQQDVEEFGKARRSEMNVGRVKRDSKNFNQLVSNTTDWYIVGALKEARM